MAHIKSTGHALPPEDLASADTQTKRGKGFRRSKRHDDVS